VAIRFDRYVVVDWSASSRPSTGRDSIWIAVLGRDAADPELANPSTRREAERRLEELVADRTRTLVTVDASFGYPAGTADWFGLDGEPWTAMWRHLEASIADDDRNVNNRFEVAADLNRRRGGPGPFWGRPTGSAFVGLDPRKPERFPISEFRQVEQALRDGGRRPASCWQLLGVGSVGSQTLTLLPILERLRRRRPVDVWPFTTGLGSPTDRSRSVLAETWPTAFDLELPSDRTRDAAQVDGVARRLRAADETGELADWFAPPIDPATRSNVEREEGWVLAPVQNGT
jgi:hypothetical protein